MEDEMLQINIAKSKWAADSVKHIVHIANKEGCAPIAKEI